jgi:hypothetical protein
MFEYTPYCLKSTDKPRINAIIDTSFIQAEESERNKQSNTFKDWF